MASQGLFVAIVLGLINGWVYQWFINHNIQLRMPEGVPPAVAKSLSAIVPGAVLVVAWLIVYALLDALSLPDIHSIIQAVVAGPLGLLGSNVFGIFILILLNCAFWFLGIHGGSVVDGIMKPVWIANLDENRATYEAGQELPNIFTLSFTENFVYLGGSGAALGLGIALFVMSRKRKASQRSKTLGPLVMLPGWFNINEPMMFGVPVVLNPLLIVPFVAAPIINMLITYVCMKVGIVPLTYVTPGWTTPPIISGVLATGSIMGSILQLVLVIIDVCLYLPFIFTQERKWKTEEAPDAATDAERA
nr:PTS transporter subunit EIIC [Corynebacterium yudongzhengii]